MSIGIMPAEMSELVTRYVDSFEIDKDHALTCLRTLENTDSSPPGRNRDPLILMAYACMYYGCKRYSDALRNVRQAKGLFERKDNPLHFDALCVLEVSILSALSRIPQALERVNEYTPLSEGDCKRRLTLLSIDLYRTVGQYENAYLLVDGLRAEEHDEYQRDKLFLTQELCDRDQIGDHHSFCTHISSSYWNLLNGAESDQDEMCLLRSFGSELAFSYAWQGRMDLATSILSTLDGYEDDATNISCLAARALTLGSRQQFDEALESVSEERLRKPGIALEEAFVAQVVRLIVLHFAGHKRDAVPLAVRLSEYASCHPLLSLSTTAQLLMVSVFLWLSDYAQAQSMINRLVVEDDALFQRTGDRAVRACLEALIRYRQQGPESACKHLQDARSSLCSPNASLLIAGLCAAHHPLLGLIGTALDVDNIPSNITELLDHTRYFEAIAASSEILAPEQGAAFQRRFSRVDTGLTVLFEDVRKPLSISLFGGLSLVDRGNQVDLSNWSRSKSHQLFLRTVLEQGSDLPREATLKLLWPDLTRSAAANNYCVTISKMFRDLAKRCGDTDPSEIISRSTCGKIRLNVATCECDVAQFETAAIRARRCVLEHDHAAALQHFYHLVELYRGDLLVGDHDYPWLVIHRERYRKLYLDSMISACSLCLDLGQPNETHFFINAALKHDPGREAFYEMSLRAYKAMGRREDALNAYYECVEYLSESLGLDPSPEFQGLFSELLQT